MASHLIANSGLPESIWASMGRCGMITRDQMEGLRPQDFDGLCARVGASPSRVRKALSMPTRRQQEVGYAPANPNFIAGGTITLPSGPQELGASSIPVGDLFGNVAARLDEIESRLPPDVFLGGRLSAPRQQIGPSCASEATTRCIEFPPGDRIDLSAPCLHAMTKAHDGLATDGTTLEAVCETARWFGVPRLDEYGQEAVVDGRDPQDVADEAGENVITAWVDVLSGVPIERRKLLLMALLSGMLLPDGLMPARPVAWGAMWWEPSLYESARLGVYVNGGAIPGCRQIGGHATAMGGYTTEPLPGLPDGGFLAINSWGTSYAKDSIAGLPGWVVVPFEAVASPSFWAATVTISKEFQ